MAAPAAAQADERAMTLSELLNADMATLSEQGKRGLAWWRSELTAMLPERIRAGPTQRALTPVARVTATGVTGTGPALVMLPAGMGLVRNIELPRAPMADLRRIVALDLDRLTPWNGVATIFDLVDAGPAANPARQRVTLAALPRAEAQAAIAAATAAGVRALGLTLAMADGEADRRFDLLPALAPGGGSDPAAAAQRLWWGIVAGLGLLLVAALVWRDIEDVGALADAVAIEGAGARTAIQLAGRVEAEASRRRSLVARRAAHDPIALLDALSRSLPSGAWVQRLSDDGSTIHLSGYARAGTDPVAALRSSPLLGRVTASDAGAAPVAAGVQPFEIIATRRDDGNKTP
jgi:general secretion pathway protein L